MGIGEVVKVIPKVPYEMSLAVQRNSDVLLYLGYSSKEHPGDGILSGKVFEYLQAKTPILALNTDASHPLVADNLICPANSVSEIVVLLESWLKSGKPLKQETHFDRGVLCKWTRKSQTERLLSVLSSLTNTV